MFVHAAEANRTLSFWDYILALAYFVSVQMVTIYCKGGDSFSNVRHFLLRPNSSRFEEGCASFKIVVIALFRMKR
jgi:hypothetical protein